MVNVHLHDHKTGMPRGQTGSLICLAEQEDQTYAAVVASSLPPYDSIAIISIKADNLPDANGGNGGGDLDAAKGGNSGNGKGTGYGQCWHCGQWGHPRRECFERRKL